MPAESRLKSEGNRWRIDAPAKLNLGLRVFPPRPDGFHDVETWMLATSWYDTVYVDVSADVQDLAIAVTGRSAGVPTEPEKNLAGRAAIALAYAARVPARARITLHKVLPHGGGIGGGSSDAASTLLALNAAWNLNWTVPELAALAAVIGSDVPFFLEATPSLCTGRGEIMNPLLPRHPLYAVLLIPPMGCPTKDVYQGFDAGRRHQPPLPRTDWSACAEATAEELNQLLVNDLAPSAFAVAPGLGALRDKAVQALGQPVHLTGSGSTLFTLCGSGARAQHLANQLQAAMETTCASVPVQLMTR